MNEQVVFIKDAFLKHEQFQFWALIPINEHIETKEDR